jgi:phage terminase small subunit
MPGRPPKPTVVLKLQGTLRKHRHGNRRDLELGGELPQPPDFLSSAAREEWHRVCTIGRYSKALSPADRGPLTLYCLLWAELDACERSGQQMQTSRMALFGNIAAKFGMDPSGRAKIQMPEEPKAANKFAELDRELDD